MSKKPVLSIIMPSLNVAKYIATCMDSVLGQSFKDFEVLCIDAGSDDGTLEILKKYEGQDSRVRVIFSEKRSYGYQINLGIRAARGRYVGIVETDDMVVPNMYETLVDAIETNECDYVKGRPVLYYEEERGSRTEKAVYVRGDYIGKIVHPCDMPELLEEDIFLWNGIYRRDFIKDMRLNESKGAAFQDQRFLLQTISSAKEAFYVDQVVYYYRQDNVNSSIYNHKGFQYITEEYGSNHDILDRLSRDWRSAFYRRMYTQARSRFYNMVDSGGFWEDAVDAMELVRKELESAIENGDLYRELIGDELWDRLMVYTRSPKDAYELEKKRMKEEKERKEEGEKIIKQLPTGLLRWYPFEERKRVLYIGDEDDAMVRMLSKENRLRVCVVSPDKIREVSGAYDYIIAVRQMEMSHEPEKDVRCLNNLLAENGTLFLAFNNRLGIRYFAGDKDIYTDKVFDGINDYRYASDTRSGTTYDRAQIKEMLIASGIKYHKTYAVLSDLDNPVFILADGYIPNEDLANRIFPSYHYPKSVFLEEEKLYSALLINGMFYQMANAFLFECRKDEKFSDALQITSSLERGKENAMITVIHGSGYVSKKAAWNEGKGKINRLAENSEFLTTRGIRMVEHEIKDGVFVMPFIKNQTVQIYLMELMQADREKFLSEMDRFIDTIRLSSDSYEGEYKGIKTTILKNAMIDMMPLNCFVINGEYVFFDQEYCLPDIPLNVMIGRVIANLFFGNQELQKIVSKDELHKRYGLITEEDSSHLRTWLEGGWDFLIKLRKERELGEYNKMIRRDLNVVLQNRERMNFSAHDYQMRCVQLLDDIDTRKIILFGSGAYARKFLAAFGEDVDICFAVDNDPRKWNNRLYGDGVSGMCKTKAGIQVLPPENITQLMHGEYKVIICAKQFEPIMTQLERMGVYEYGVYNPSINYYKHRIPVTRKGFDILTKNVRVKKYHIGYCAGAFDMFHIGHLNLLRRAKERCDYLIVGVMSDERMYELKQKCPVIPCNERMQVVAGCRYVDQVEELQIGRAGIMDAYEMFHFDCMFSGDDHADNPGWLAERDRLREHGADIVFVPYTKETSSSEIRERMRDGG